MSQVLKFNSNDAVSEQASLWMVRLQDGLDSERKAQFDTWLAEDQRHAPKLMELATLWDDMGVLTELAPLFEGWPAQSQPKSRSLKFKPGIAIAASIALVLGVSVLLMPGLFERGSPDYGIQGIAVDALAELQRYETKVGEYSEKKLSDGSVLTLNSDTRVSVSFTPTSRTIVLDQGEAHFEVVKNSSRPLSVLVADKTVRAVGTAFSVKRKRGNSLEVAVDEGLVAVYAGLTTRPEPEIASLQSLSAGQVLTIENETQNLEAFGAEEMEDRLAWRQGMVVIQDETLDSVIAEFEEHSNKKILLADKNMSQIRLAGYFRLGDVEALLVALEQNFGIASVYYQEDDIFVLSQQ